MWKIGVISVSYGSFIIHLQFAFTARKNLAYVSNMNNNTDARGLKLTYAGLEAIICRDIGAPFSFLILLSLSLIFLIFVRKRKLQSLL